MSATQAVAQKTGAGDFRLTTAPGIDLFVRYNRPPDPRGTVLVVHGVGEHSGRYGHLEQALVSKGWAYYGYDHRGHGQSTGRRVHIDRWEDYTSDLQRVYDEVRSHAGEGKVFVYGHSMGALITATWGAFRRPTVWGLVLSAIPLLPVLPVPKAKIVAAKVLSRVVPTLALANEVDPAALSHDPAVGPAYMRDPLVERKATVRWGAEILRAIDEMNARAAELELPVLLVHGSNDAIASSKGSAHLLEMAVSADKASKVYAGMFHEVHNELAPDREKLFADLMAWLDARV